MRNVLLSLSFLLVASAAAPAQICAPLLPSGQPALMPFTPMCFGVIPPPMVWAMGNPGFAISSFAPLPIPPGMPTFLMIGPPVPPLPIAFPLIPAFGLPGLLTNLGMILVPAGPSGPVPAPPTFLPVPATGGPLGLFLSVHTLVMLPGGIALTGAIGITI